MNSVLFDLQRRQVSLGFLTEPTTVWYVSSMGQVFRVIILSLLILGVVGICTAQPGPEACLSDCRHCQVEEVSSCCQSTSSAKEKRGFEDGVPQAELQLHCQSESCSGVDVVGGQLPHVFPIPSVVSLPSQPSYLVSVYPVPIQIAFSSPQVFVQHQSIYTLNCAYLI